MERARLRVDCYAETIALLHDYERHELLTADQSDHRLRTKTWPRLKRNSRSSEVEERRAADRNFDHAVREPEEERIVELKTNGEYNAATGKRNGPCWGYTSLGLHHSASAIYYPNRQTNMPGGTQHRCNHRLTSAD